ncbi:MAG TPA: hypothetical protein EYP23_00500 [Thermoplasmata archaeon]|nr:hypothetical protein [Thermoplasmata archaeon]
MVKTILVTLTMVFVAATLTLLLKTSYYPVGKHSETFVFPRDEGRHWGLNESWGFAFYVSSSDGGEYSGGCTS